MIAAHYPSIINSAGQQALILANQHWLQEYIGRFEQHGVSAPICHSLCLATKARAMSAKLPVDIEVLIRRPLLDNPEFFHSSILINDEWVFDGNWLPFSKAPAHHPKKDTIMFSHIDDIAEAVKQLGIHETNLPYWNAPQKKDLAA